MKCIRKGNFGINEVHKCFQCEEFFSPGLNKTCSKCNWKICNNNHCGCTLSHETKKIMSKFYKLLCTPQNYTKETRKALEIMIKTYYTYCLKWLI